MDKDRQIITQVCAKIAADLVNQAQDTDAKISEFAVMFATIKDIIFESCELNETKPLGVTMQMVQGTFPGSTVVGDNPSFGGTPTGYTPTGSLEVVGKQHGDIPEWLITACRRDGVTRVYDNRDGLAINNKRPWFKAVDGDKAYWAPKARK